MGRHEINIRRSIMEPTEIELEELSAPQEPVAEDTPEEVKEESVAVGRPKPKSKPKKRVTEKPEEVKGEFKVKAVGSFSYKGRKYILGDTFEMSGDELDHLKSHLSRATARDGHAYIVVG
jgi:hypothetical protein